METLQQVVEDEPPSLRQFQPSVLRNLEMVCLKCLRKDPAERYLTAGGLTDDLDRWLRGEAVIARPVSGATRLWRRLFSWLVDKKG